MNKTVNHRLLKKSFASDNNAGVHPAVMDAILSCNTGHTIAYGDDPFTETALIKFREYFDSEIDLYFVYGGTAANVLGLETILHPHEAVFCAATAHIYVDECGAPEKFTGSKLIPLPSEDGKISIEQITPYLHSKGFPHHVQPRVISITQPTEYGTLYTIEEIQTITYFAHQNDMLVHMDGARISNAAVALDQDFKTFTMDAGIDVLSFGGTKNGLMFGEAVIFFDPQLSANFKYIRKQGMQLHSKMRYIAAQFSAFLSDDLWRKNALQANRMAGYLKEQLQSIPEIELTQPVQTNAIFARVPEALIKPLQNEYFFYVWQEEKNEVRWMTSFDTTQEDINQFVQAIRSILSSI